MSKPRQTAWTPPRGIRLIEFPHRPTQPHGVQWRVDGRRKTKTFPTREKQIDFAKGLAADAQQNGVAAYRLNESEAREWRAFRAMVGPETDLALVAACWERNKAAANVNLSLSQAIAEYTTAKAAEGVDPASVGHYGPIFDCFLDMIGDRNVGAITDAEIATFMAAQKGPENTKRTRFTRIRALFNWLVETRKLDRSPLGGMKAPKVKKTEVVILTLEQSRELFRKNATNEDGRPIDQARRETVGRLALEAFAGLRNDTAGQIVASEIHADGLRIPAAKIKTEDDEFLEGLPANLHAWLTWSKPSEWKMTQRQYLEAKVHAFTRAGVPHPRNCLRKGFASYHVAAFKNPPATSLIMCHRNTKLLFKTYRGKATQADGLEYFKISPPV